MALKNSIPQLPVPMAGVHAEVSRIVLPEQALHDSRNVIAFDGLLESRPGHRALPWSTSSGVKPIELYSAPNIHSWVRIGPGYWNGFNFETSGSIEKDPSTWTGIGSNPGDMLGVVFRYGLDFFYAKASEFNPLADNHVIDLYRTKTLPILLFHVLGYVPGGVSRFVTSGGRIWVFGQDGLVGYSTLNVDLVDGIHPLTGYKYAFEAGPGTTMLLNDDFSHRFVDWDDDYEDDQGIGVDNGYLADSTFDSDGVIYVAMRDGNVARLYVFNGILFDLVYEHNFNGYGIWVDRDEQSTAFGDDRTAIVWLNSNPEVRFVCDVSGMSVVGLVGGDLIARDGASTVSFEFGATLQALDAPLSMFQFNASVENDIIVIATENDLIRVDTGNETTEPIGSVGGAPTVTARPVFRTFDMNGIKHLVWTSLPGKLMYWDGAAYDSGTVEALDAGALCISILSDRMMRCNLGNGKEIRVDISAMNDFTSGWGEIQIDMLDDTPGVITAAKEISPLQTAIYKTDSVIHAVAQIEFGGVSAPVRYETTVSEINGPPCPHAVIGTGDGYHIFMGIDGGIYVYDGARVQPIAKHARFITEKSMDFARKKEVFAVLDRTRQLVTFYYPSRGGGFHSALVVDPSSGSCWPMHFPANSPSCGLDVDYVTDTKIGTVNTPFGQMGKDTIGGMKGLDRKIIIGFLEGVFGIADWDEATDFGSPIDVSWSTGFTNFGIPNVYFKTLQEMFHSFIELSQLSVQPVWLNKHLNRIIGPSRTITKDTLKTSHRHTGRMFAFDFSGKITDKMKYAGSVLSFRKRGQM